MSPRLSFGSLRTFASLRESTVARKDAKPRKAAKGAHNPPKGVIYEASPHLVASIRIRSRLSTGPSLRGSRSVIASRIPGDPRQESNDPFPSRLASSQHRRRGLDRCGDARVVARSVWHSQRVAKRAGVLSKRRDRRGAQVRED